MLSAFDLWTVLWVLGIAVAAVVAFLLVQMMYLSSVLAWGERRTRGLAYYGQPPAARQRFKRTLRLHGLLLWPILRLLSRNKVRFEQVSFVHDGVAGPKGTCSKESFAAGAAYSPGPEDVFVVTQMKCGTTWMQHLVYELLRRGGGDLVERGQTLYGVSPWLEAETSVPIDEAPLVGDERPSRIIKTHLPAKLCPWSEAARYVYVVRHPVSCFASCVDFIATNVGAFTPPLPVIESWFRSPEQMWWGTWPDHVDGWWQRAQQHDNVLWVRFEDMKRDLRVIAVQVAAFLGLQPLTDTELDAVLRKCSFDYMKQHDASFEMHPPHLLATDAELFVSGRADRHHDVPAEARGRILEWCRTAMAGRAFPLARFYPDVPGEN